MVFDVAIVGAGVIGLTAALSMSQRGCRVALFDQRGVAQMQRDTHRVYALNEASIGLLKKLGMLKILPDEAFTPYERMHVWVGNTQTKIDFDARLVGEASLGGIVLENALIAALYAECAQNELITFFPETTIQAVELALTHIEIKHQQQAYQAKLLMIADGPNSQLRSLLNIALTEWSYKQTALVTTVETTLPHQNTCYQCFTDKGPLALLPLDHPHQCSIVWSASAQFINELYALSEDAFNLTLSTYFENKLGPLTRLAPLAHFPLRMRHVKQYVGTNWMILGDAAHTIHPMAGLGLNVGFADLTCWLTYFDEFKFEKMSRALQAYQRERKTQVWKVIGMMDGLKMLFSEPIWPMRLLRDIGLQTCDALPALKRFFIMQAKMG